MPRANVTIECDISVECSECGKPLSCHFSGGSLEVSPCAVCMDAAYDQGAKDGEEKP